MNVQGRKAELIKSSSLEFDGPHHSNLSSYDQPREIEVEGVMEEYLAFDSKDLWVVNFINHINLKTFQLCMCHPQ